MNRSAWVGTTLLAVISAGVISSPALAASTGGARVLNATTVEFKAGAGNVNTVVVTRSGRVVTIDDRVAIKAGKGCKAVKGDKTKVRCTTSRNPTLVRARLGDGNDTFRSALASVTYGENGNDTLRGGAGNDALNGGNGTDTVYGLAGNDKIWGMAGTDVLRGGDGNDGINGGADRDDLYGEDGNDRLVGEAGNDAFRGGPGDDSIDGGDGGDYVRGEDGDDKVWGQAGNDMLEGGDGDNRAYGGDGNDVIRGGGGDNRFYGGAGNDDIRSWDGEAGDDVFAGEGGDDILRGWFGDDVITGGDGNDSINGDYGDDRLFGGAGNDKMSGSGHADLVDGGAGDDILAGDEEWGYERLRIGADVLIGGPGTDQVTYYDRHTSVTVDLDGEAGDDGQAGEGDTVGADVENLKGGNSDDVLTGNDGANVIDAHYSEGYNGTAGDVVHGLGGDDTLHGGYYRTSLFGDAGNDTIHAKSPAWDTNPDAVDGGADDDLCLVDAGVDAVTNCERLTD